MGRALLAWILSFTLAVPAWSLNPSQVHGAKEYLSLTQMTKKSVPVGEFYQKVGATMPVDMQREMELFLRENPNAKMPQMKMSLISEGSNEVVQLEYGSGNDKGIIRIEGKNRYATIQGVEKGKKFYYRMGAFELKNPVRFLSAIAGKTAWTEVAPTVQILTAEQVKQLGDKEKRQYIDHLREVLEAAEKVQAEMNSASKKSGKKSVYWSLLNEDAWAWEMRNINFWSKKAKGSCIVAGWVGQYDSGGSCFPPDDARKGGCTSCNPEIYGSNVCIGKDTGKLDDLTTNQCNVRTEKDKYAVFKGVKNEDEVKKKLEGLSGVLTKLREACIGIDEGIKSGYKGKDQKNSCESLRERIGDLEKTQCQVLEANKEKFPDLKCNKADSEVPPPASPPIEQKPPGAPAPPPYPPADPDCVGLPSHEQEVRCEPKQRGQLECSDQGQEFTAFYCRCYAGEDSEYSNTNRAVGCSPSKPSPEVDRPSHKKPKKEESLFKPWMIAVIGGLAVAGLYWWLTDYSLKQQATLYATPTAVPVATPVPPPVTTGAPAPNGPPGSSLTPSGTR